MTPVHVSRLLLLLVVGGAVVLAIYSLSTDDFAFGVAWLAVAAGLGGSTYFRLRRSKLS